jgi:hypothetical protein
MDCGYLHEQTDACLVDWAQVADDEGVPIYQEVVMADSAQVQVFIDARFKQCVSALQQIALLADTGSREHKERFGESCKFDGVSNGWRVAEAMREIANDTVGALEIGEDLTIYKRALDSMAAQIIHPKMTGLEMAKMQLGEKV